jgi:Arc/MetJ family transcription regulator
MRTNIVIDEELLEEAMKLSGARTKKDYLTMKKGFSRSSLLYCNS